MGGAVSGRWEPASAKSWSCGQRGVSRVLVRGLPFPFAGGLAPSPQGHYVAFGEDSNEDYRHAVSGVTPTAGLWLVTSVGTHLRRLLVPPRSVLANRQGPGNVLNVGPVAWSSDRSTLAYAVNPGGGAFNLTRPETKIGVWLTRYDHPRPRLLVTTAQLGAVAVSEQGAASGMPFQIVQLSWSRDGRTLAVSTFHPALGAQTIPVIMAVNGTTGHSRVLVNGGQEAVFSPTAAQLAYTTAAGSASRMMSLCVADAGGQHARVLVTVNGLIASPAWSPDGHTLAYITDGTVIHTVDVATGTSRVALTATARGLPAGGRFRRLAWLPTHG